MKTYSPDEQATLDDSAPAGRRSYSPMRFVTDGAARRIERLDGAPTANPRRGLNWRLPSMSSLWAETTRLAGGGRVQAKPLPELAPDPPARSGHDVRELLTKLMRVLGPAATSFGRGVAIGLRALWRGLVLLALVLWRPVSGMLAARKARRARRRAPDLEFPDSLSLARRGPNYVRRGLGEQILGVVPLVLSVSVVGAMLVAYQSSVPKLFSAPKSVLVPRVTDRPFGEAVEAGRTQGFAVELAGSRPTDDVPKGIVIAQDPRPDSRLQAGEPIRVTVSAGLRPPNLIGKTLEEARVALIVDGWGVAPKVETKVATGSPPNVVVEQHPAPDEAAPQKGPVSLVVAAPNLAYGKSVVKNGGGTAGEAVDGQPGTVAWIPGMPNWIEINLGGPATVSQVDLLLAQEKPGRSSIELWGWDADGKFFPLHLFNEETADNAVLSAKLPNPSSNLVRLRVATTGAPSPIGWREITVVSER